MTAIWRVAALSILRSLAIAATVAASLGVARAEPLSGGTVIAALKQGGYVLLMRHARSPEARPDKAAADPENTCAGHARNRYPEGTPVPICQFIV
jgi:hypothetical protein